MSQSSGDFSRLIAAIVFTLTMLPSVNSPVSVQAQNDPANATPVDPADTPDPANTAPDNAQADMSESEAKAPTEEQTPDSETLPKLEDLDWPTTETLLRDAPEDWIVMHTGRVLIIPSLFPRPDHLGWLDAERKKLMPKRPRDPEKLAEWMAEFQRFDNVLVAVSEDGVEADYLLPVRYVAEILHHEDLALKRANVLREEGNLLDARRLIDAVAQSEFKLNRRRRSEKLKAIEWPGLIDSRRALVAAETRREIKSGSLEAAFHLLTLYGQQDREFEELTVLFGEALKPLSQQLIPEHRYRELRYYIDQTREFFPQHPTAAEVANRLKDMAAEKLQTATEARQRKADRQAALAAYEALWIWPRDAELTRKATVIQEQYPILRTGLLERQSTHEWYRTNLLDHHWIELDALKQGYPRYRSRFIESWIPLDLGRTVNLSFRPRPAPLASQPPVGSHEFFNALADASLQCDTAEQGLFAPQLTTLARRSPSEVTLKLAEQTPHPFNFLAAVLAQSPRKNSSPLRETRFQTFTDTGTRLIRTPHAVARRVSPLPNGIGQKPIAEVHNFTYPDAPALLRGLLRDEVDYLPDVPPAYVKRLQADKRFTVSRYQLGLTQRLQFRLSGSLRDFPELRLAMCLMLDREALLDSVAPPAEPGREWYRTTNSLTPQGSHGYQPLDALIHDPIAARSLAQLLKQKPEFPSRITLLTPPDRDSRLAAEAIVSAWEQLGLETTIVEPGNAEESNWDVRLQESSLLSPWSDLPSLLTDDGRITTADLEAMPHPLRTSLMQLETAYDWQEVNQTLGDLQRYLLAESWVLPLWERRPFQVIRREIRNLPPQTLRPAQDIDLWIVPPQPPRL
ncbi:hypothetical protein GYB59_06005 [bacterium]|nr:hypothetical protein [bacterium]